MTYPRLERRLNRFGNALFGITSLVWLFGGPRLEGLEIQELGGAHVYLLSDVPSYTTSIDIPANGVI